MSFNARIPFAPLGVESSGSLDSSDPLFSTYNSFLSLFYNFKNPTALKPGFRLYGQNEYSGNSLIIDTLDESDCPVNRAFISLQEVGEGHLQQFAELIENNTRAIPEAYALLLLARNTNVRVPVICINSVPLVKMEDPLFGDTYVVDGNCMSEGGLVSVDEGISILHSFLDTSNVE